MIKVDEPYNPEIKRNPLPFNIVFRLIKRSEFDAIVKLSSLRNPTQSIDDIKNKTDKEITNKEKGVQELYSIVDAKNLTSIRMHESFGFRKIKEAEGFLHVKLESGRGYLYRKTI
jgi:hypothetical protein